MNEYREGKMRQTLRRPAAVLLAVALAFTLLNAVKPLHIDDTFIYHVAEQMTEHPLDPYDFSISWLQWPHPAHEEVAPPVVPLWWSLALRLFGERPLLWKLWSFPFAVLFAFALHAILRRMAPGFELPLVGLTMLSPTFLPGFNLMQDIPAMALALGALALFLRAGQRGSLAGAVVAGLVAGLALQTKYTAAAVVAAMVAHSLVNRRWRDGFAAAFAASLVFLGWEVLMTFQYGQSMFFGQLGQGVLEFYRFARLQLTVPFVVLLGATAPVVALLGLLAAGVGPRAVLIAGGAVATGFTGLLWFPLEGQLFLVLGGLVIVALVVVAWKLLDLPRSFAPGRKRDFATELFLLAWLLLEIAVFFAATPFPAVRRVMGVVVVATVLCARLLNSRRDDPGLRPAVRWLVALGVALGLLYYVVDLKEARAQRDAVHDAAQAIHGQGGEATIWFVGHWGFQYYAERSGMLTVVPDRSLLRAGDWLLVPDQVHKQEIRLTTADVVLVQTIIRADQPALTTGYGYYGGSAPLQHLDGPRLSTAVYRIKRDVIPRSAWSVERLANWAKRAGGQTAAAAVPALARALYDPSTRSRRLAAEALAEVGPLAFEAVPILIKALEDYDPGTRYWSAVALGNIGSPAIIAKPYLERTLQDPDANVRAAAAEALGRLGF